MEPHPTVEITDDGSATLRSAVFSGADGLGDTYHSTRGAVGEARHVFIEAGFLRAAGSDPGGENAGDPTRVLEIGFGTGLNAWLTLLEAERTGRQQGRPRPVEYTAVELYPVPEEIAAALEYTDDPRFAAMHSAKWGEWTQIGGETAARPAGGFRLLKLHGDLVEMLRPDLAETEFSGNFDLIYHDAFAPETQPELWTPEIFARIFAATAPGGVLVTYSAKGDVRRALQAAGFTVERLPGALGKRHMLRASKIIRE